MFLSMSVSLNKLISDKEYVHDSPASQNPRVRWVIESFSVLGFQNTDVTHPFGQALTGSTPGWYTHDFVVIRLVIVLYIP